MKISQTLADKKRIGRNIKGRSLIFRRLFRQVAIAQESRVLQGIPSIIKPTLSNVMDREHENRIIALAMRPFYITTITDSASEIFEEFPESEFGKAIDPMDALEANIFKYANQYSIAMAKYVNKTTARKIKKIIREGLKERLHYSEIVKRVRTDIFKSLKEGVRARRLAHTEAHGMIENGRSRGARVNKMVKEKTWSAAMADARDTHAEANGQTVPKNDTFIVGGYRLMYPGDTSLGAGLEEIINCRCSALYSSRIHEDRLTTSKELLARHKEQKMRSALEISRVNEAELREEIKKYKNILNPIKGTEAEAKKRISEDIGRRLHKNTYFQEYAERRYRKEYPRMHFSDADVVNNLISDWAGTSGDANPMAIAMQMAAREEFGLTRTAMGHFSRELQITARKVLNENKGVFRAFLRAQYNATQEFLAKNGVKSITGYRGMNFDKIISGFEYPLEEASGKMGIFQLQPISSFSADVKIAKEFALMGARFRDCNMVIQSKIPVNRILGTCQTGYGCKKEVEFIVLGGKEKFKVATFGKTYVTSEDIINALVGAK